MQRISSTPTQKKAGKQGANRRFTTSTCKGGRSLRHGNGGPAAQRASATDRFESAILKVSDQLCALASTPLPPRLLGEPVPSWDYVKEFALFIRQHATGQNRMAVFPFCVTVMPSILIGMGLHSTGLSELVAAFDKRAMGVMTRTKGRSRSTICLPAIHPIEFVGMFLAQLPTIE